MQKLANFGKATVGLGQSASLTDDYLGLFRISEFFVLGYIYLLHDNT